MTDSSSVASTAPASADPAMSAAVRRCTSSPSRKEASSSGSCDRCASTRSSIADHARALRELLEGRTSFVIAHRLSTIREADRIYVIDSGKVVQQGSFAELAGEDGLFKRLCGHSDHFL